MRDFRKFCLKKQEQVIPVPDQETTGEHDYVEIGGIRWATMNIGANSITDTGLYFQWGDTQGYTADQIGEEEGQKPFHWEDYKFNPSGDGSTMTKYTGLDGKVKLDASDDAATAAWGEQWKMPSQEEAQLLIDSTVITYTPDYQGSGISGTILTDKQDSTKTLFFPFITNYYYGGYWLNSTTFESGVDEAFKLYFSEGYVDATLLQYRYSGLPIRAVMNQ